MSTLEHSINYLKYKCLLRSLKLHAYWANVTSFIKTLKRTFIHSTSVEYRSHGRKETDLGESDKAHLEIWLCHFPS